MPLPRSSSPPGLRGSSQSHSSSRFEQEPRRHERSPRAHTLSRNTSRSHGVVASDSCSGSSRAKKSKSDSGSSSSEGSEESSSSSSEGGKTSQESCAGVTGEKGSFLSRDFLEGLTIREYITGCERFLKRRITDCAHKDLPNAEDDISAFFGISIPSISLPQYIYRLVRYCYSSPSTFVIMLVYVERLINVDSEDNNGTLISLNAYNMHRIMTTCLMISCKMLDDHVYSNSHYARVGGVPTAKEMTTLEVLFLRYIDNHIYVNDYMFQEMRSQLKRLSEQSQLDQELRKD